MGTDTGLEIVLPPPRDSPKTAEMDALPGGQTSASNLRDEFGWALAPYWANRLSKPIKAWLNQQGCEHAWWVDDILVLGTTKEDVETMAATLVNKLTDMGIQMNQEKTMKSPAQVLTYLGHKINLRLNVVEALPEKAQVTRTMIQRQIKGSRTTPKHLAALAGHLLDAQKSNVALTGIPQQLMKQAAKAVHQNAQALGKWNKQACWRMSTNKPSPLQVLLMEAHAAAQQPVPRPFREQTPTNKRTYILQTDASDKGWGATLSKDGREIGTAASAWTTGETDKHITHREALASALGVQALQHHLPDGTRLTIETDAISTAYAWNKGSKVSAINAPVLEQTVKLAKRRVLVTARHIPGQTNKRADWLSRNPDPKNYALSPTLFQHCQKKLGLWPSVDLFANRHNRKCRQYCSWRADPHSLGNAFAVHWGRWTCWVNPPWELIPRVLDKIRQDQAHGLLCLPVWKTAPWWRDLQRVQRGKMIIVQGEPIFQDPDGKSLPPPRWATLFTRFSGS